MDNRIFEMAQSVMTQRRLSAVSQNDKRIDEVNKKIPEIYEINKCLFNTGKELMKIIAKKKNVGQEVEKLKQTNLEAQAMIKNLLLSNGYPEDYLEIQYNCPDCQDTGYCNGEYCSCFKKLYGNLSANEMNKNSQIKLSSFDTFSLSYYTGSDYDVMKRIFEFTKEYARNFRSTGGSILMFGRTGLGKTHLSLSIANVVLSKGYSVIYDSAINILRKIEREHFGRDNSNDTLSLILDCDLLILDDLGTEYETPFYSSVIYNIINTRLGGNKPTIISTNLDYEGIERRYDERVVSRLCAVYTCLEFKGEDIRLQKQKRKVNN
ncbi:MAG: DNA replication protein DnaC [Ruminococcus sp.]|nr:DNA replication protein DnaC [Ruminococcus sp.]